MSSWCGQAARVPVDGVVVGGHSFIDQAAITGESMPVEKIPGARVYAGTVNQSGVLEIQTETVGRDTAFGKIIEAVEQAERSRAPVQKTADRLAGYLVYFALACALFTFILTHNARSTISVVIVAGACGIAAGTPLAILGRHRTRGTARRHREGRLVHGNTRAKWIPSCSTRPARSHSEIPRLYPSSRRPESSANDCCALPPARSGIPNILWRAPFLRAANDASLRLVDPEGFSYTPGKGISCRVDGRGNHRRNQSISVRARREEHRANSGPRCLHRNIWLLRAAFIWEA